MNDKLDIVRDWLPRYTGQPLEAFGDYVLLTNFIGYLEKFCALTGASIVDLAARGLLTGRLHCVVVTSAAPASRPAGCIQVLVVTAARAWRVTHPRVATAAKGAGDFFSASLLAHWLAGGELLAAVEQACGDVLAALRATQAAQCAELLLAEAAGSGLADEIAVSQA